MQSFKMVCFILTQKQALGAKPGDVSITYPTAELRN